MPAWSNGQGLTPFDSEGAPGMEWVKALQISDDDREKFLSGNAKRSLKL
jgi:predicted TIM-barrel fold metal-dependent hydrolase